MENELEHLETKYWTDTIICHPELEEQCPWGKFGASAWHDILLVRPEFVRHAPQKLKLSLGAKKWLEIMISHPELDAEIPATKSHLSKDSVAIGKLWGTLLSRHPQFAKYEPWKHFRRDDWKKVLSQQPQFISNYERNHSMDELWQFTLTPSDQAEIIASQPSLFNRFKTTAFQSNSWQTILFSQPQFRARCNLNKIGPNCLGLILERYPQWLDYCDTYSKTPEDILRIAEHFPEVMNHYDLDRFKEIGGRDTPWIEKYPSLVRFSRWNFSYSYWDFLLTNCSNWLMTGRRPRVDALADEFVKSSSRKGGGKDGSITRPLPDNPRQKNLRNSLDSIMDYRFWVGLNGPIELMETIPLHIRKILKNKDLTYDQLAIRMVMMPEEDCGMIL